MLLLWPDLSAGLGAPGPPFPISHCGRQGAGGGLTGPLGKLPPAVGRLLQGESGLGLRPCPWSGLVSTEPRGTWLGSGEEFVLPVPVPPEMWWGPGKDGSYPGWGC